MLTLLRDDTNGEVVLTAFMRLVALLLANCRKRCEYNSNAFGSNRFKLLSDELNALVMLVADWVRLLTVVSPAPPFAANRSALPNSAVVPDPGVLIDDGRPKRSAV